MVKLPTEPQALLLGCVQSHEQQGEYVLSGRWSDDRDGSWVTLVVERDTCGLPGYDDGLPSAIPLIAPVDPDSGPGLQPAELERARWATLNACVKHGWLDAHREVEVRSQQFGRTFSFSPQHCQLTQLNLREDGVIALGLWRQHKARNPPAAPTLTGRDRAIMTAALDVERLGFVLAPVTQQARKDARRLARQGWGARGHIGASVSALCATPLSLVETHPQLADQQLVRDGESA